MRTTIPIPPLHSSRQEVDVLHHVRDVMDQLVDQTEDALCVLARIVPVAAFAAELIIRIACFLGLMLPAVLAGVICHGIFVILSALHIAVIPCVITVAGGNLLR